MRRTLALIVLMAGLASASAVAHHSYGATYDVSREVTVEGRLVQFILRNPHSFVMLQGHDDTGRVQRWSVEWSGTAQLGSAGITSESLKAGDQVVIVGRPSRVPGEFRLLMLSLVRPSDGFTWGRRPGETVD